MVHWDVFRLVAVVALSWLLVAVNSFNGSQFMENYPTPFTEHNRVLGCMLSYSLNHLDPLAHIFNEYVSMCEGGWNPTIVLFTTGTWTDKIRRLLRYKMWCYRTNAPIEIRFEMYPKSIGIALGIPHRQYMAREIDNYDVFIYHEDDIVVRYSHLAGYLIETQKLHNLQPADSLLYSKIIGFQRFRRLLRGGDHHNFGDYGEQDIIEQELIEETPSFKQFCIGNSTYLSVEGNTHQAMWMATRSQVLWMHEKCAFLNQSNPSREYMSSFSIFGKQAACNMHKILPGERFSNYQVWHYYQQRHVSWTPVFTVDDDIHAGYNRKEQDQPECWRPLVNRSQIEQSIPSTNYTPQAWPPNPK